MDLTSLTPSGSFDAFMRLVMTLGLLGWNVFEGFSLRTPYPSTMVALWSSPLWRVVLLFAVWLGSEWCPRVGMMTAIAAVMYIANMVQIAS
jgi:hypothetical protein